MNYNYTQKYVFEIENGDLIGLPSGTTLTLLKDARTQEVPTVVPYKVLSKTDNRLSVTITLELEYVKLSKELYKEFSLQEIVAKIMFPSDIVLLLSEEVKEEPQVETLEEIIEEE